MKDELENILRKSDKDELIKKLFNRRQFNFYSNNFERCEFQKTDNSFDLDIRLDKVILVMEALHLDSTFAFLHIYLREVAHRLLAHIKLERLESMILSLSNSNFSLTTGDLLQNREAVLRDHNGLLLPKGTELSEFVFPVSI